MAAIIPSQRLSTSKHGLKRQLCSLYPPPCARSLLPIYSRRHLAVVTLGGDSVAGSQFAVRPWRLLAPRLKPHGGTCSDLESCLSCSTTVPRPWYGTLRVAPTVVTDLVKRTSTLIPFLLSPWKPHKDGRLAGRFGYWRTEFQLPPKSLKHYFKMPNATPSCQLSD